MCQASSFYSRFIARIYDPFMERFEERVLRSRRQKILEGIHGNVLEIGAGTGINFPLYPAGVQLVACEPSAAMLAYAYERLDKGKSSIKAEIELVHAGIGDEALQAHVPAGGFDAIVCTLVLCTVPNQENAIETIQKWLKPGGTLRVLEHICATKPTGRFFQNLFNPIWRHLAEGCNLNRQTDITLKNKGFQPIWEDYFFKGMPFYQAILR